MTINTHNNHHNHTHHHHNSPQKMQRCQDHILALEEERRKIQVFQRELPLCLDLVTQAIEACKQQLSGTTTEYNFNGQSECSEQTSSDAPVLEEFIPLKRASSSQNDDEEHESKKPNNNNSIDRDGKNSCKKSDWLRSVQLWNQTPDPPSNDESPKKVGVVEVKRNGSGGAFHPFRKEKSSKVETSGAVAAPPPVNRSVPPASTSSSAETGGGGGNKKAEKEGQSERKARRCWSTELHRKFLHALQQLGGSHLATPKQIRELMKVDGLTNDEVKSHLQKYRLHSRRPSPSIQNNNGNSQTPQFVVVGGIWVPPEYAAMATTATSGSGEASAAATSNGVYAPVATLAAPRKPPPPSADCGGSLSEGGVRSHSPATSSSTHTTTASPTY